jgi:uncharacterized protein (TIGR02466 family)|tara:strand:- start:729 stop:1328 length:600 start_codon:yes stop_codon:yes gene_type:complete
MIFNTFIHYFHSLIDPPNVEELLKAAENAELHEQQFFAWKNDCEIEVERLAFESMGHEILGPTIDAFFSQLPPVPPDTINIRVHEIWRSTYTRGCFQEIHDHLPHHLSGVLFLDDHEENCGRFYFHHRHYSELTQEWKELYFPQSRMYIPAKRGQVLLFPSHMMHGVTVHRSDKIRRTVAFNINLELNKRNHSNNENLS